MTRGFSLQTGPGVKAVDAMRRKARLLRAYADLHSGYAEDEAMCGQHERAALRRDSVRQLRERADELDGGADG